MLYVKARIPAALVTWPKRGSFTLVSTPEYCTVLNTLFALNRNSRLRVSPKDTVRDSDELTDTVPGSSIELRVAVPYCPAGRQYAGCGRFEAGHWPTKAAVLNQCSRLPCPWIACVGLRFGRRELGAPAAISCAVSEYVGLAKPPVPILSCPEMLNPSSACDQKPPLFRKARFGPTGGSITKLPLRSCR